MRIDIVKSWSLGWALLLVGVFWAVVSCAQPTTTAKKETKVDPVSTAQPEVSTLSVVAGSAQAVLGWTRPLDVAVVGLRITGPSAQVHTVDNIDAVSSYTWTGLTNDTPSAFTVQTVKADGTLSPGLRVSVTPGASAAAATPVTNLQVHPGSASTLVTWKDPAGSPFQNLQVDDGSTTKTVGPGVQSVSFATASGRHVYRVTPLTAEGTSYSVAAADDVASCFVLSYFSDTRSLADDSLHLASSSDGLHWTALNATNGVGNPVLIASAIGGGHIRDPFVVRRQDGSFTYLATDWTPWDENWDHYWNGTTSSYLVVADSTDLVTYTNLRTLLVSNLDGPGSTPSTAVQMHAWAPEAYWDSSKNKYAIVWSGNGNGVSDYLNRAYVSYTSDFQTVDSVTPSVFFYPETAYPPLDFAGDGIIDSTVVPDPNGGYYLFFKDSRGKGQDIMRAHSSSSEPGTFTAPSLEYITRGAFQSTIKNTEGPFIVKDPTANRWYLFADFYTNGGVFGCWATDDLSKPASLWTNLTLGKDYSFPASVRHANTVQVTRSELNALKGASWSNVNYTGSVPAPTAIVRATPVNPNVNPAPVPTPAPSPTTGDVVFSLPGGNYEIGGSGPVTGSSSLAPYQNSLYPSAVSVTLSAGPSWSGASIYYTTDGSAPTSSSTPYTAPLSLTTSQTIKAVAVLGATSSPILTQSYGIFKVYYNVKCGWKDSNNDGIVNDGNFALGYFQGQTDRDTSASAQDSVTGKYWGLKTKCDSVFGSEGEGGSWQRGWWGGDKFPGQGGYLMYQFELDDTVKPLTNSGKGARMMITAGVKEAWDSSANWSLFRPIDIYMMKSTSASWDVADTGPLFTVNADQYYRTGSVVVDGTDLNNNGNTTNGHDILVFAKCKRQSDSAYLYDEAGLSTLRVSVEQLP